MVGLWGSWVCVRVLLLGLGFVVLVGWLFDWIVGLGRLRGLLWLLLVCLIWVVAVVVCLCLLLYLLVW